jgi:hypothetical protein
VLNARWRFGVLLDPDDAADAAELPVRVEFAGDTPAGVAATALAALFDDKRDIDRVALVVDGDTLGVCTRKRIAWLDVTSVMRGVSPDPGSGDGATLPGYSTRYTLLAFRCGVCAERTRLLFADDGKPLCRNGHGPMEQEL